MESSGESPFPANSGLATLCGTRKKKRKETKIKTVSSSVSLALPAEPSFRSTSEGLSSSSSEHGSPRIASNASNEEHDLDLFVSEGVPLGLSELSQAGACPEQGEEDHRAVCSGTEAGEQTCRDALHDSFRDSSKNLDASPVNSVDSLGRSGLPASSPDVVRPAVTSESVSAATNKTSSSRPRATDYRTLSLPPHSSSGTTSLTKTGLEIPSLESASSQASHTSPSAFSSHAARLDNCSGSSENGFSSGQSELLTCHASFSSPRPSNSAPPCTKDVLTSMHDKIFSEGLEQLRRIETLQRRLEQRMELRAVSPQRPPASAREWSLSQLVNLLELLQRTLESRSSLPCFGPFRTDLKSAVPAGGRDRRPQAALGEVEDYSHSQECATPTVSSCPPATTPRASTDGVAIPSCADPTLRPTYLDARSIALWRRGGPNSPRGSGEELLHAGYKALKATLVQREVERYGGICCCLTCGSASCSCPTKGNYGSHAAACPSSPETLSEHCGVTRSGRRSRGDPEALRRTGLCSDARARRRAAVAGRAPTRAEPEHGAGAGRSDRTGESSLTGAGDLSSILGEAWKGWRGWARQVSCEWESGCLDNCGRSLGPMVSGRSSSPRCKGDATEDEVASEADTGAFAIRGNMVPRSRAGGKGALSSTRRQSGVDQSPEDRGQQAQANESAVVSRPALWSAEEGVSDPCGLEKSTQADAEVGREANVDAGRKRPLPGEALPRTSPPDRRRRLESSAWSQEQSPSGRGSGLTNQSHQTFFSSAYGPGTTWGKEVRTAKPCAKRPPVGSKRTGISEPRNLLRAEGRPSGGEEMASGTEGKALPATASSPRNLRRWKDRASKKKGAPAVQAAERVSSSRASAEGESSSSTKEDEERQQQTERTEKQNGKTGSGGRGSSQRVLHIHHRLPEPEKKEGLLFNPAPGQFSQYPKARGVWYDPKRNLVRTCWKDNGKIRTVGFPVSKFGLEEARALAVEYHLFKCPEDPVPSDLAGVVPRKSFEEYGWCWQ